MTTTKKLYEKIATVQYFNLVTNDEKLYTLPKIGYTCVYA